MMDPDQFEQLIAALDALRDLVGYWGVVLSASLGVVVGVVFGWMVVRGAVE